MWGTCRVSWHPTTIPEGHGLVYVPALQMCCWSPGIRGTMHYLMNVHGMCIDMYIDQYTVWPHLSVPQISSSLTFCGSFYWNGSVIFPLYTILQLPHFIRNVFQNRCVQISEVRLYVHIYGMYSETSLYQTL